MRVGVTPLFITAQMYFIPHILKNPNKILLLNQVKIMVIAKNLSKTFQNNIKAVNNLSFHIAKGETVGLIGTNGAGKTTLIKLISGLLKPDSGFVRIFEDDPLGRRTKKGPFMGLITGQRTSGSYDYGKGANTAALQDELTVELNMELTKTIYKIPEEKYRKRLGELSDSLDLKSFLKYRVDQLSLGQRMRAEIAVVLLYEPELLILDEPFIGVDLIAKEAIRQNLQKLSKDKNTTIILTTHNVEEIEKICERVIFIDKGNMIFNGSFDRIKYTHASINSLNAELTDKIPDMQDLPIIRYAIENNRITVWYDSAVINTRDITAYLLSQCEIKDLLVRKPTVEEIIRKIYEEDTNEQNYN